MALKSKPLENVRSDVPVHQVQAQEIVRVNILVSAVTRKAWKQAALDRGVTVTDLIIRAMQSYIDSSR